MLALVLAMIFCVAIGTGVVGYVMLEARREGRGEFWTAEGEELIAGARRTGEKVRTRGGQLGRTAAGRTRHLAARLPEAAPGREAVAGTATNDTRAAAGPLAPSSAPEGEPRERSDRPTGGTDGYRAAS